MEPDPPPDPEHLGYEIVAHGEFLLPIHKRWNSTIVRYDTEAGRLSERHEAVTTYQDSVKMVIQRLALPWNRQNWDKIWDHFSRQSSVYPPDIAKFIRDYEYGMPWNFINLFRSHLREADGIALRSFPPALVRNVLEVCVEEKISWTEQDFALDAAISRLPLASRVNIDVSVLKGNYQLFVVAITNAFPIPEDQFDYHLRRYHAIKVTYAHINLLIEHYKEGDPLEAAIPLICRPYAWVMFNVIMRFLYHARTFDPTNHLKDRTLYGWTTGLLWKWINACHRVRAGLTTVRDDNPFQPGSDEYDSRIELFGSLQDYFDMQALREKELWNYPFSRMLDDSEWYDISPDLTMYLFSAHEELRNVGLAAEILRVLPHSTDPTFLGLDDELGEKDEIAQLYDRMRAFVDVREYAYCEEHGGIGDW